jgi:hypothetical protein
LSPSFTALYPVSPANQILAPVDGSGSICSTAHDAHRDLKRSNIPRPVKCCAGVHVRRNASLTVGFDGETLGRATLTVRDSHQSRQCMRSSGTFWCARTASLPKGANTCGFCNLPRVVIVFASRLNGKINYQRCEMQ